MNLRPYRFLLLLTALFLASGCSTSPTGDGNDGSDELPAVSWAVTQFGSAYGDFVYALAPAAGGGVYATGLTEAALAGASNLGGYDAYLLRVDETGQILWAKQLGTPYNDFGRALAVDAAGNVFLAGDTNGDLDDDTASYAGTKVFVIKLDADGNQTWHTEFGSSDDSASDQVHAVTVDPAGGFYVAGVTWGDLFGNNQGYRDAYVANYRYDENSRTYLLNWFDHYGTLIDEAFYAALTMTDGGVVAAGYITDNCTYNDQNYPEQDVVIVRYDASGGRLWVKPFGTECHDDLALAMAPAPNGDFYLAGVSNGEIASGEQQGADDAFVARFDSGGNLVWIHQLGTGGQDAARALAADGSGGVYVVGTTDGEMVAGSYGGLEDVFVAHYDASGNLLWIGQKGTSDNDEGWAAAATDSSQVFVGGATRGDLAGQGSQVGDYDAFVASVGP